MTSEDYNDDLDTEGTQEDYNVIKDYVSNEYIND
jgi:hypothetical protein